MAIIRQKREQHFSIVSNDVLNDERLSFKARGLLVYMLSMKDDWKFYVKELAKHSQKDGRDSIQSALRELEAAGYLQRIQARQENGRFGEQDWLLTDTPALSPQTGKPLTVKPETAKPRPANPPLTITNPNKNQSKQELNKSSSSNPLQEIKDPFAIEAANPEEEEDQISKLISGFIDLAKTAPFPNQLTQIDKATRQMSLQDVSDVIDQASDAVTGGRVRDPVAYLIQALKNSVKEASNNGERKASS